MFTMLSRVLRRRRAVVGCVPVSGDAFTLSRVEKVWDDAERAALVALLRERPNGLTWQQIMDEVDARSSALAFWKQSHPPDLLDDGSESPDLTDAARDIAQWQADRLGFMTFLDEDYPAQLRAIRDLPPVLFHHGRLVPDEIAMSVVGSRNASDRGLSIARSIAAGLVDRGIAVVSGLARGIDTAAHTAALEAGGRVVAVIGTGINKYYPAENRLLQDRIAAEGLVLSQFWPDAPPSKSTFPMRNTVMSGYGRATIVVEAGEKSGARIQANRAVAHGRPVVLTDLVVTVNKWAQNLVDKPGVHVADSTADVMRIVDGIKADHLRLRSLLTTAGW
jgi:DNA protecting protein DprA